MKVSEKSLELNIGAELLALMRGPWGMPKAYLRGLTQKEEKQEGVDFFAHLPSSARIFAFQFKAPKGTTESIPYKYTLVREQHEPLYQLSRAAPSGVFYVFPFYVTIPKLQSHVPQLFQDTWLVRVNEMHPSGIFGGTQRTRTIRCRPGRASVNPEFAAQSLKQLEPPQGVPALKFSSWYEEFRTPEERSLAVRISPWLVRGLRLAISINEA